MKTLGEKIKHLIDNETKTKNYLIEYNQELKEEIERLENICRKNNIGFKKPAKKKIRNF